MARGKQLFDTCVPCHGAAGEGNQELGAPAIAGMDEWYLNDQLTKFMEGVRGKHPGDAEGQRMRPMARTLYKEGDVSSISEYVASLPKVEPDITLQGGDVEKGEEYYVVCAACHGADGKGVADMHAPSLIDQDDWYLLGQLEKYRDGKRGDDPNDPYGSQMQQMVTTLEDEQAMKDVLAYVRSLSN
jgi:cytochrome c oxidase subunit 2